MENRKSTEKESRKTAEKGNRIVLHNVARELTAEELEHVAGGLMATPNPSGTLDNGFADDD